jgi:hypothetical protein
VGDRGVGERRLAEVAVQHMVEVEQIALRQRLVEAVMVLERRDGSRVARRLLTEIRRDRVRRHELRQQEGDGGDADQQEDERGEPPRHETREPVHSAEPTHPRDRSL